MTPTNNQAPLLCYFKLFALFRSHWWIEIAVTVRKCQHLGQIRWFFIRVTLKFDWLHWKIIGHLFYPISSFVHHFVPNGEFFQIGVTGWPWKTTEHLSYDALSFVHQHHFNAIIKFKLKLESGNAQFGSKSTIFLVVWPRIFCGWPWKTLGYVFYATSRFVHHFVTISEFKLESQSGNAQFGSNSKIFRAV